MRTGASNVRFGPTAAVTAVAVRAQPDQLFDGDQLVPNRHLWIIGHHAIFALSGQLLRQL